MIVPHLCAQPWSGLERFCADLSVVHRDASAVSAIYVFRNVVHYLAPKHDRSADKTRPQRHSLGGGGLFPDSGFRERVAPVLEFQQCHMFELAGGIGDDRSAALLAVVPIARRPFIQGDVADDQPQFADAGIVAKSIGVLLCQGLSSTHSRAGFTPGFPGEEAPKVPDFSQSSGGIRYPFPVEPWVDGAESP